MSFRYFLFIAVVLACQKPSDLNGQETPEEIKEHWANKFPDKNGVILKKVEDVQIKHKKDELVIESTTELNQLFFNNNAKLYSNESVFSNSFIQSDIIEAFTYVPDGKKYSKVIVTDFWENDEFGRGVFFSDDKRMKFNYPGMTPGAQTHLLFNRTFKEPRFLGSFFFSSYLPVVESSYSITCPKDVTLEWKLFGMDTSLISFSKTTQGKNSIYKWTARNVPEYKHGPDSPDGKYYLPHMQLHIVSYSKGNSTQYILRDASDLHRWYVGLIKSAKEEPSEAMKALADSIVQGKDTEVEKVKAVYYWVQDQIKYIAFEDGLGGFIPRKADLVCERKYGDCKDMSNTIYALLTALGIKAHHAWIGSRSIPYSYSDVPTPRVDNHMICVWYDEEKIPYFLDATGDFLPFGLSNSFIQGKEALVNISNDSFIIERVPVTDYLKNIYADTFDVRINDGILYGKGSAWFTNYYQVDLNNGLNAMSAQKKEDYFNLLFQRGNNKSKAQVEEIHHAFDRDKPLILDYKFEVHDYVSAYDNELYFNPHMLKEFKQWEIDSTQNPYFVEEDFEQTQIFAMTVYTPKGYIISQYPKDVTFDNKMAGYSISYKASDDGERIDVNLAVHTNFILMNARDYHLFNSVIKSLRKSYGEIIIYRKS